MQTCCAKWLSMCSGYCEFNALVYVCRVELSLFLSFSFVVFLLVPVLFACATIWWIKMNDKFDYSSWGLVNDFVQCPNKKASLATVMVFHMRRICNKIVSWERVGKFTSILCPTNQIKSNQIALNSDSKVHVMWDNNLRSWKLNILQ